MAKRPSSPKSSAIPLADASVAPSSIARPKVARIDPKPGAQADPRLSRTDRTRSQRGDANQAPADLPQLDRDNRHRERINIPDSHKGATPKSDHKRNDRTPKRHR